MICVFVSGSLRELYALAASQQPLASLVNQQQRLLFRHYDIAQHVLHQQQGAVSKLLGKSPACQFVDFTTNVCPLWNSSKHHYLSRYIGHIESDDSTHSCPPM
ncbi:hypothetical protein WDU94_009440 [Cyamophila willieti]